MMKYEFQPFGLPSPSEGEGIFPVSPLALSVSPADDYSSDSDFYSSNTSVCPSPSMPALYFPEQYPVGLDSLTMPFTLDDMPRLPVVSDPKQTAFGVSPAIAAAPVTSSVAVKTEPKAATPNVSATDSGLSRKQKRKVLNQRRRDRLSDGYGRLRKLFNMPAKTNTVDTVYNACESIAALQQRVRQLEAHIDSGRPLKRAKRTAASPSFLLPPALGLTIKTEAGLLCSA